MPWRRVTGAALIVSAAFALAIAAAPGLACKPATSRLRDDFTNADPAPARMQLHGKEAPNSFEIGGKVVVRISPQHFGAITSQDDVYAAAGACVHVAAVLTRSDQPRPNDGK